MATPTEIQADTPVDPIGIKPKRRLLRRFCAWLLSGIMGVAIVIGLCVIAVTGQTLTAPDWARARIEQRAAEALPGMNLQFGDVQFTLRDGWQPHVRLQNVNLLDDQGANMLSFSEFEADLSKRALFQGQAKLKTMLLTGVVVSMQREKDGQIILRGGTELSSSEQNFISLPDLIERLDAAFETPALGNFRSADIQALTLQFEDVRTEQAWVVDGGRLRLNRDGEELRLSADLAVLSGGAGVATVEANYTSQIGDAAAEFGINIADVAAKDIAAQSLALAWLDVLRAPISGALRGGVDSDGTLAPLSATLQIGAGVVQPTQATKPIPFQSARSYFTYDAASQTIDFAEVFVKSEWITTRAEGQAFLGGLDSGKLSDLTGQFELTGLGINPSNLYEEPRQLDGADMDFQLQLDPFVLRVGQMLIYDQGQTMRFGGDVRAAPEGWRFAVDGQIDTLAPERLLQLWPDRFASGTRNWIDMNILAGSLHNAEVALRKTPNTPVSAFFSFDYADATVRLIKTMPPVTKARGQASMLDNRFVVAVDGGRIVAPQGGAIDVAGSTFSIPDITVKGGAPSVARLRSDSTVTAALSLLNQEKLEIMDKAGLDVALADGRAVLTGTLALPLKKQIARDEIEYDVQGELRAVRTSALVPGKTLASDVLQVQASNSGVKIGGQGRIGQLPFDATWAQDIGTTASGNSVVRGTVELSERTIDEFNIGLPTGFITGSGRGDVTVELPKDGPPKLTLASNLRGLQMRFAPLGWSKNANQVGSLKLTARLGGAVTVDEMTLDAAGLKARGNITTTAAGGLERATFGRVQVGNWLDAPVTLVGRGKGAAPAIEVSGGTLDLRRAEFGAGGSAGGNAEAGGPMRIRLDRLQITDTLALNNMRGEFTTKSGLDGSFSGALNGGTQVSGRVLPQNGRSAVRITSQDAGGIFASAGLLKQARGGALSLTLLPVGKDGAFDGKLNVQDTRIKDAPAIAALLNALSIVGLLEQMGGSGIHFNEVEAAFRLTPSTMTLTEASAVGPSMGISMDGIYSVDQGTVNMQGVISPIYLLNGIGSILTRKGEGLIGFNYSLTGAAKNPTVRVNPLSALTPGMFRDLFRAPAPKLPATADGIATPTAPKALLPEASETPEPKIRQNSNVEDR
ncbi:AsmA-like C-terminal region-containing protein [Pseudosulfitobacter sp. SM2401]|uniref:YhdP family protein n=1 Tax=Pseudosulfitobacter sp. SM2401 TaxID=3350098 RepID=UPI0036F3BF14